MNLRSWRRTPLLFALTTLLALSSIPVSTAAEPSVPSLRLFASSHEMTARRYGNRLRVSPPVWITPVGGSFELHVSRPNYETPISINQVDPETNAVLRTLPSELRDDWRGLDDFAVLRIRDESGDVVFRSQPKTFCPNTWGPQRISDVGPDVPTYPRYCGGWHPFIRGMVWGLDAGWAVKAFRSARVPSSRVPDGEYTLTVTITKTYIQILGIPRANATETIDLTVRTVRRRRGERLDANGGGSAGAETPALGVPDDTSPDPSTLPDLLPVPAWGFNVSGRRGREFIGFLATEWNAGPSQLVVEGFRRADSDIMDAYQYFYDGREVVGRAPVGTLEFDRHRRHNHWHFEEFTQYSLLDETGAVVAVSPKQSWCLVPTDAIDLTVPGAQYRDGPADLWSSCGSEESIWIREHLGTGWGDTYGQYGASSGVEVTDLPNGRYFLKVEVNPTGVLYEADTSNNVMLREIRLRGTPGDRWVVAPPWNGIDTEGRRG